MFYSFLWFGFGTYYAYFVGCTLYAGCSEAVSRFAVCKSCTFVITRYVYVTIRCLGKVDSFFFIEDRCFISGFSLT